MNTQNNHIPIHFICCICNGDDISLELHIEKDKATTSRVHIFISLTDRQQFNHF